MVENCWAVYCLISYNSKRTYVGATVDVERRLKQHNGELVGGARATKRGGSGWRRALHVLGFPDSKAALQFEWKWKHLTRAAPSGKPMERRLYALATLVNSEKSTSSAVPFSLYLSPLTLFCEDPDVSSKLQGETYKYAVVSCEN
jgi:predicted GIY-YIG superfamily endonuclease